MNFTYWTLIILVLLASGNILNFIDSIDGEKHKISSRNKLGLAWFLGAVSLAALILLRKELGV